jgi:flagellar assembly factor FliW
MILDTANSRSAINALVARCPVLPVSDGIPFRIIRRYATFIPKKDPAVLELTMDNAMSIIGIMKIKQ